MMKSIWVLLFAGLVLVPACRKNSDETSYTEKGPIRGNQVEAALIGKVRTTYGSPISFAQVEVGGTTVETDANGIFTLPSRLLDDKGSLVQVSKSGYFSAYRFAFPQVNSTDYLDIQLVWRYPVEQLDADAGGTISFGQGASVTFPADAIAGANGSGYLGTVLAYTTWLDPTSEESFRTMPGDLRAIDAEGYPKLLKTFGMVGIELESPDGEKLNLRAGKTARISFPVPPALRSAAPATIPLWHFNTANGYWEEEGTATLVGGDHYEGEVGHFSFWNVDVPGNFVKLSMRFGDAAGTPISGLKVQLSSPSLGMGSSFTNSNGQVSGLVPANETLLLRLIDRCDKTVYEDNIGYFTTDTDLGKINISGLATTTVSGTLLDCNNEPLPQGLVSLVSSGDTIRIYALSDASGAYTFSFLDCSTGPSVTLIGYDTDKLKESSPLIANLTGAHTQVGPLAVCNSLDEYIVFYCNGYSRVFVTATHFEDGSMWAQSPPIPGVTSDNLAILLEFKDVAGNQSTFTVSYIGVITVEDNEVRTYGCDYCVGANCNCAPNEVDVMDFNTYPTQTGEYADGSVSGKVLSGLTGTMVPFSLYFRLKKQ
ncbi:MAG: carboxypeptidase regulatory-like domain-containing protein [Saprospiraceae bacterium]|nr:carboxypeptidase regulatory-like domain-containing protein [Saprospiraceae bacterium]